MRAHYKKLKQFTKKLVNFHFLSEVTWEDLQHAKIIKKKLDDKLVEGKRLLDQEKLHDSLTLANEAIELNPHASKSYLLRGEIHLKRKDDLAALKDFSQSLALSPTLAGFTARSKLYLKLNQKKEMQQDLKAALELKQKIQTDEKQKIELRAKRVRARERINNQIKELRERPGFRFSPAFNLNRLPEVISFQVLGMQHYKEKNVKLAMKCFNRALALNEYDVQSLTSRALGYYNQLQLEKSEADFTRVIELNIEGIGLSLCHIMRGTIYSHFNRYPEAKKDFTEYMRLDPTGKYLQALHLSQEQLYKEILKTLKELEESASKNFTNHSKGNHLEKFAEAKRHIQRNQLDLATKILTQLIIENPSTSVFYLTRGQTFHLSHANEKAFADFTTAIWLLKSGVDKTSQHSFLPKDFFIARRDLLLDMGLIEDSLNDHYKALKEYSTENLTGSIFSTKQEAVLNHVRGGQILQFEFDKKIAAKAKEAISSDNLEEAIRITTIVLKKCETNPIFYVIRGTAYRHLRKKNAAREDFLKALKLDPNDHRIKLKCDNLVKPSKVVSNPPMPAKEKKSNPENKKTFHVHAPTRKKSSRHPRESGDPSKIDSRLRGNDNSTTCNSPTRESGEPYGVPRFRGDGDGNDNSSHKQEENRQRQNKMLSARRKAKNQTRILTRQQKQQALSVESDEPVLPSPSLPDTTPFMTQTVQKTTPSTITPRVTLSQPCPHVGTITLQPTEEAVLTLLNQANELAYTIGGSVRQRLAGDKVHANSDIDIVTSASSSLILNLFKSHFDIEPTRAPNLFRIFSEDNLIEIWSSATLAQTRCSEADAYKRDFVDNVYSADAKGNVWYLLPEKEALATASEIHTIINAEASLSEDPTRILRAIDHSTKTGKRFSEELAKAMEKKADLLVKTEQCEKTNARMLSIFSQGNALRNYTKLLEFKFFETLFSPHAADLRKDNLWIVNELNLLDHAPEPPTLHEIYAILITSLLMQNTNRDEQTVKSIISANTLFKKNSERYCNLNPLLLNLITRWEYFHLPVSQLPSYYSGVS